MKMLSNILLTGALSVCVSSAAFAQSLSSVSGNTIAPACTASGNTPAGSFDVPLSIKARTPGAAFSGALSAAARTAKTQCIVPGYTNDAGKKVAAIRRNVQVLGGQSAFSPKTYSVNERSIAGYELTGSQSFCCIQPKAR